MAKQLNVSLAFSADTSQAQKSIQNLQTSLAKISSMKIGDNLQLKEASDAAKMLSYHLNQAYNTTTGNIDLSALNHSLQKSSTNVTQLSNKLLQAGSNGQQAFVNLAQAISSAEYPMFKLGKRLTEFGNTLKNTIRWQFSSSLLHGMMGAYQQAIGYAEDLNASLTNIRVVTGNSTEEMARFAEYANKAAKSLSTTTTAYTDAALIFYQQGLKEKDVKERTDITVKMANVTGDSVTTVSDQLTAIWNNFNKSGDVAYEHYADVLTALGAKTASSTDEIAGGLEKFAAIADTIGLSYEYAAAALATITSNTRQSEEVVGTALKTIFARLQGLKLGETLEDGTDLNKYSEALQKVGVDVLDATGELRRADDILVDMAAKWETLSNAEQVALAQAVGGVRQYNQIVALMDEWDSGDADSMLANLETAYNADGALQKQADIWAESWEGARNRVKTATEGVYDSILDDKLFIGFNNVLADMLSGLEQVIDGVGGLKGVFIGVGSFILSLMAHKIQPALTSFVLNIKSMFSSAQAQAAALTGELQSKVSTELSKTGDNAYDTSQKQALSNANNLAEARTRLTIVSKNLTEQEKLLYQFDISLIEQDAQKAQSIADEITAIERERDALYQSVDATQEKIAINQAYDQELKSLIETQSMWKSIMDKSYDGGTEQEQVESSDEYVAARQAVDEYIASKQTLNSIIEQTTQAIMDEYTGQEYAIDGFEQGAGVLQAFTNNLDALSNELGDTNRQFSANEVDKYKRQLDLFGKTLDNLQGISADTKKELAQLFAQAKASKDTKTMQSNIAKIISKIKDLKFTSQQLKDMGISLSPSQFKKFLANLDDGKRKEKELIAIQDELNNKMNNFNPSHMIGGLERLTSAASAMGSVAMMGQSISSMINSWGNADLSFGEKLSTTFMSLSMLIPGTISAIKGLNTALQGTAVQQTLVSAAMKLTTKDSDIVTAKTILLTKAKGAQLTVEQKAAVSKGVLAAALAAEDISLDKNTLTTVKNKVAAMVLNGAKKEEIVSYLATIPGITAETAAKIANKLATDALKTSIMGLLGPIALIIAAVTAVVAAFTAWNKAQEEAAKWDAEQNQEQVDKIMERVDALKTERQEFESLMKAYEDAKANQDGTAAAQQAIADATWDICEALGIEIDLIDKLQGKADGYDSKIYEESAVKALEEIKKFQEDWDDIDKNFYTQYRDAVGTIKPTDYTTGDMSFYATNSISKNWYDENGVSYSPEYGRSAGGFTDSADEAFRTGLADYLQSSEFKYADKMTFSPNMIIESGEGAMQFKGGVSAAEQYQIISDMVSYMSDYLTVDQQKNSEMFKWYEALVDAGENTLSDKDEATAEVEAQIQKYAQNQTQVDTQMSYDQVETYEQYLAVRDAFVENLRKGYSEAGLDIDYSGFETAEAYLESIAEKFLLAQPAIAGIQGVDQISKDNPNLPKDQLETLYGQYKDVFFDASINFDEIKSIAELENILKTLQAEADAKSIQAKIDIVDNAKGNLKEDMSYGEYMDYESSSGIKWGQFDEDLKTSIIDYTSFLQMSYEEQVSYLDSIQNAYNTAQAQALSTNLTSSRQLMNQYLEEYQTLQDIIDNGKQDSAAPILQKIEELKVSQNQYEPGTEGYEKTGEGISILMDQYEALMAKDGLNFLSEEQLARMYELERLMGTTQGSLNSLDAQLNMVVSDILSSATSVSELEASTTSLIQNGIAVDYSIYADALVNLASEYDNCTNEIQEFQAALNSNDAELMESKQQQLEAAMAIGEAANEYGIAADTLEDVANGFEALAESGEEQYKILKEDGEALADASVRYVRLNEAVLDLAENYDDYSKVLKDISESTDDVDKAMIASSKSGKALQKSLAGLLGTSEDIIDTDLLSAIDPKDFENAAKGDEAAIERIRDAFIELQAKANDIDLSGLKEEIAGLETGIVFDISANEMPFLNALIQAQIDAGATAADIQSLLSGFNIDATVSDFEGTLGEAVAASESASAEIIANTSFSQDVKTTTVDTPVVSEEVAYSTSYQPQEVESFNLVMKNGADEPELVRETRTSWVKTVSPEVVPTETTDQEVGTEVTTSNAAGDSAPAKGVKIENAHKSSGGRVGGSTRKKASQATGGGGGGGSKSKKTSEARKKRSDIGERYKEITDKIEDQTRVTEKASSAMDKLYGTGRIRAMRQLNKELEKEVELLKQKREEAENYLKEDARELESAAGALGYTIRYDQGENISNYTAIMDQLYKDREKLLDSFGNEIDETEQEALDALDESIERFESAVSTYDETKGILKDLVDEIDSKVDEQMSLAADELSYRLELRLEVDDRALTRIEYLLSRMEDDFFQMGEQAALLAGEKYSATVSKLQNYQTSKDEWDAKLAAREVTPERYAEAMQEIYDGIYTELGALEEIDNAMKHYYEDTVAAAGEEIAKYTDRMSRAAGVLEHYKSVLTLIGKSTDYKKMGAILDGQTQTIKNSMAAAKTIADMYYEQAKEKELLYKQALAEGNEEVAARYKLEWEAALGAAEEASDEYQGLVEQWAENVNAILENTLAGLKQDLEKTITGGSSFDDMLTAMDRAESLQEEYLTTTNKIYETNKLMRKAQQDIDKSTNSIAKKRLKQFITETQELQNQTKLSNYELEIQQAKYNLLLAEIAVEEARNAKSTVRLQRDNEGNFGYVYTADTSAVDAAVQQYEDAQNRLYNLSLEGANEYSRKYLQTLQEMSDAFSEIEQKRMEGHYATNEEYQQAMDAAKKYYYEKLENYSYLYSVALGTDANVAQEAWSTEFGTMTTKTEEWKTAVNSYVKDAGQAFKDWKTEMDAVESAAGIEGDLDALKTKVGEVTTESGLLLDELTGEDGLLAAIKQEFIDVSNATTAWDTQYTTLKNVRNEYDLLGQSIKNTLDEMSKVPDEDDVPNDEIDSNDGKDKPDDTTPDQELKIESQESVPTTPSYLTGNLTWKGNGASRVWTDSAGNTYKWNSEVGKAIQAAFNTAVGRNGGYTGDFFLGWNTLSADELQKYGLKDVTTAAFDTGGYTGSWGSYGKLAILHEKELILKPQDTENFLASMDLLNKIVSTIDLYTINAQLGGALNSPYLGMLNNTDTLEQSVHIEANFPSVTNHLEIEEALSNLVNTASQFANRK